MTINKKLFTNKKLTTGAFILGVVLAVAGSVVATTIGTNLSVDGTLTNTGAATLSSTLAVTGVTTLSGNLIMAADKNITPAAGTGAFDFSGGTGIFKTSTGAVTIGTGAVTISGATTHSSTVAVGSSGTVLTQILSGTCNPLIPNQTIAATTSLSIDCSITGIVSGDKVFVQLPKTATSTLNATSTNGGWVFQGASASTTNGFLTITFMNRIGQATQIPNCGGVGGTACGTGIVSGTVDATGNTGTGLGSSTQYWIVR